MTNPNLTAEQAQPEVLRPRTEVKIVASSLESPSRKGKGEDSLIVLSDPSKGRNLFGVFDGASGLPHGREASIAARDTFATDMKTLSEAQDAKSIGDALAATMKKAHKTVAETGGITTASVGYTWEDSSGKVHLSVVHVGDSMLMILREKKLLMLRKLVVDGKTEEDNLAQFGHSNLLTQSIGGDLDSIHSYHTTLKKGDKVLLATDGVTGPYKDGLDSAITSAFPGKRDSQTELDEFVTKSQALYKQQSAKGYADDATGVLAEIGGKYIPPQTETLSKNPTESQPSEKPRELRTFPPGTMVRVERTGGLIEEDWFITGQEPGRAVVRNSRGDLKRISLEKIDRLNPSIPDAVSWDGFSYATNQLPGGEKYTGDLINKIDDVRSGRAPLLTLTRAHGIRAKAEELIRRDREEVARREGLAKARNELRNIQPK